jgi:hypothetical protein
MNSEAKIPQQNSMLKNLQTTFASPNMHALMFCYSLPLVVMGFNEKNPLLESLFPFEFNEQGGLLALIILFGLVTPFTYLVDRTFTDYKTTEKDQMVQNKFPGSYWTTINSLMLFGTALYLLHAGFIADDPGGLQPSTTEENVFFGFMWGGYALLTGAVATANAVGLYKQRQSA